MDEPHAASQTGKHVITQNLVSSANLFAKDGPLAESTVEDLAAFIDVFCLYDQLTVLGKPADPEAGERESDFLGLVRGSGVVRNEVLDRHHAERTRRIATVAQRRFAAFLAPHGQEVPDDVAERLLGAEAVTRQWDAPYRFLHIVESSHDLALGLEQLRSELAGAGRGEGSATAAFDPLALNFVLRTFLYLAYADTERLTLTLDSSRQPVAKRLLEGEAEFRSQVLKRLHEAYGSTPSSAELRSKRRLSPFAAIVFQRARPHKGRIVSEIERLRGELAGVRDELRTMEGALYKTDVDARRAEARLERALTGIDRHFTTTGHLVSLEEVGQFASDLVELLTAPENPKAWIEVLLGLPKVALERWLAQRTLLNIHRLRDALPASEALRSAVHELFGDLVPYGEPA